MVLTDLTVLQQNHALSKRIAMESSCFEAQGIEGESSEVRGTLKQGGRFCGTEQNIDPETQSLGRYPGVGFL